jgi:hypothetical protein
MLNQSPLWVPPGLFFFVETFAVTIACLFSARVFYPGIEF